MLPKCSLTKYICINAFDYNAIMVYFTVLKPGTLYLAWYSHRISSTFTLDKLIFGLVLYLIYVISLKVDIGNQKLAS